MHCQCIDDKAIALHIHPRQRRKIPISARLGFKPSARCDVKIMRAVFDVVCDRVNFHFKNSQIKIHAKITRANASPSQSGLNTHHHDQVIYPVNFSPINKIVRRPANPTPPLLVVLESLIYFSIYKVIKRFLISDKLV